MEIHHHPKHSDKSRNYKEYLFEFFVIFIAIAGSFFAENLREHYVDKHKEKGYIRSMYLDLETESIRLKNVLDLNKTQIKGLDSLLGIMSKNLVKDDKNRFYYYNFKYASNYNAFVSVDRALNQLMNNGGLNLIKNIAVSDGIMLYSNSLKSTFTQAELLESRFQKILDQQKDLIDLLDVMKLAQGTSIYKMTKYPDLITRDKKMINAYYYNIFTFKGSIIGYTQRLNDLIDRNTYLIQLIKKEYNIKGS